MVANTLPPDDVSGVGEQVLQLTAGLGESGHEVRVFGRSASGTRAVKLLFPVSVVIPFLQELRRFRPHLVQVHESDGAFAALALKILGPVLSPEPMLVALLQVSYWQEFLSVRPIRHRGRVLGRPGWRERCFKWFKAPLQIVLGWLTVWLADRVLAPSATTAGELERDYGARGVRVVPNVVAPLATAAERPAVADGDPIALFVGRLRIRKGLEVALDAFSALPVRGRLLIVGDGEHRSSLEAAAARLRLGSRVEFLGRKQRSDVEALMDSARVLLVPSLYEGMPLVIVEAMQRGLPVIASAVSGIPEVVVHGETGWLVPCEDPEALAEALNEAFEKPAEARRRGERGRDRLKTEYSPAGAAAIWERAIDRAPGTGRSGKDVAS